MIITTGIQIAFDSGFLAEIVESGMTGISRGSVQSSHMGTTGGHTFSPTKLYDPGGMRVQLLFNPATTPPIDDDPETITITFSDSAATEWSFSGFMTDLEWDGPLEDRMTATVTIKASGDISW